ncbi:GFA family protein [Ensifer aridi]|uniref:GFA family protein n=1 Tax=Ensifer aridi TaxID=1708715 RepID=UPI0004162144|nr:hypothetical protein [Ensifer aridi]
MLTSHAENSNPKEMGMHVRLYQAYSGRCHCGKIAFEIESNFPELTTCDCSICRRKNALMVKVHERRFRLLQGQDNLVEYRFHTGTARHFFAEYAGFTRFIAKE